MRRDKKKNPLSSALAIIICAIVLCVAIYGAVSLSREIQSSNEVQEGIAYLESLEKKDPAVVLDIRRQINQKKLDAQRDALLAQLSDGTIDPFSLFKDYVVMGDSRAVGFWYRDFLDKDRVLADGGHTIRNISEQMETLVSLNPSTIYLCYGLNDCSIGYWDTAQEYVTEYMQTVAQIRENLPETTIVVSSILPAKDPAFELASAWYNIPDWSAALEQACKENGILFANCDQLAVDYPDLWDPDGIHFREAFYPYWASNLVVATLMEETQDES